MTRGWKKTEKSALLKCVKEGLKNNLPLKEIFANFGEKHNRKADSVRNFYYACLSESNIRGEVIEGIKKNEIHVFSNREIEKLLTAILSQCEKGMSVRGAITSITTDKKLALRYQNKYRNLVKTRNPILLKVLEKQKQKQRYFDPFAKQIVEIRQAPIRTLLSDSTLPLRQATDLPLYDKIKSTKSPSIQTIKKAR